MLSDIRLTLLISLTVLVIVLLFKWFKRRVMMHDLPTPIHAELVSVEVMYHPLMLRVEVSMPKKEELFPAMLTDAHQPLHNCPVLAVDACIPVTPNSRAATGPRGESYRRPTSA